MKDFKISFEKFCLIAGKYRNEMREILRREGHKIVRFSDHMRINGFITIKKPGICTQYIWGGA